MMLRGSPAAFLLVALLAGLIMAGCTGDTPGVADVDPTDEAGGAVLRGTVLSEELAPVGGALVAVDEVAQTTTAEDGTFEVTGLAPGSYRVVVQAIGFIGQAKTVDVHEGEPTEVQFTLAAAPIKEPDRELLIFEGYEVCTLVLGVFVFGPPTVPCTEEPQTSFLVNMSESWRYLVVEMDWETSDSMWLILTPEDGACNTGADNWCWNQLGTAPLRIEGGPEDERHARQYALDGETPMPAGEFALEVDATYAGMFRDEVNGTLGDQCNLVISTVLGVFGQQWNPNLGCGLGYGYSTGVRFTYYVTIFHWEPPEAPGMYTGIPDQ